MTDAKRNAKAVLVDEVDADGLAPGSYAFFTAYTEPRAIRGMIFVCPCGCGDRSPVHFTTGETTHPRWTWNGNREKPTLTPSLNKTSGCLWHGYLTDGEFREC